MLKTLHSKTNAPGRKWHLFDAQNQVLGRLATQITHLLLGKGRRDYSTHVDNGDHVVVVNARGIRLTGTNKIDQKMDFRHSGYPGGDTMTPYRTFLKEKPDRAVYLAVKGMLPKNKLRSRRLARLKIYKGDTHPHGVQFPGKVAVAS